MSTRVDAAALDCPIAFPRPGEGYGLGGPPFRDEALAAWVVSRYADCDLIVRDAETFSSKFVLGASRIETFGGIVARVQEDPRASEAMTYFHMSGIASDGDLHRRERTFFNKAFTPKRIAAYEPTIRELCDRLTDAVVGRTAVPFVEEFAMPLPVQVIAYCLGMPQEDFRDFKRWSDGFEGLHRPRPTRPRRQLDAFLTACVEFTAYIHAADRGAPPRARRGRHQRGGCARTSRASGSRTS